jgi:hypothetical protein
LPFVVGIGVTLPFFGFSGTGVLISLVAIRLH